MIIWQLSFGKDYDIMTLQMMNFIHLNNEKTRSEILCSSSLLGWITASDISHSWKQNTIIMFFHHSARLTCTEEAIDSLCFWSPSSPPPTTPNTNIIISSTTITTITNTNITMVGWQYLPDGHLQNCSAILSVVVAQKSHVGEEQLLHLWVIILFKFDPGKLKGEV